MSVDARYPESQVIDGLELRLTCPSHPEQYDVYEGEFQVGYLRLRNGFFRADIPDVGGATVYACRTFGDGMFKEHERQEHLTLAVQLIKGFTK